MALDGLIRHNYENLSIQMPTTREEASCLLQLPNAMQVYLDVYNAVREQREEKALCAKPMVVNISNIHPSAVFFSPQPHRSGPSSPSWPYFPRVRS